MAPHKYIHVKKIKKSDQSNVDNIYETIIDVTHILNINFAKSINGESNETYFNIIFSNSKETCCIKYDDQRDAIDEFERIKKFIFEDNDKKVLNIDY